MAYILYAFHFFGFTSLLLSLLAHQDPHSCCLPEVKVKEG